MVRYRLDPVPQEGPHLSDALGNLTEITPEQVVVETRRGPVRIPRAAVVTARRVPPPPTRR